MTTFGMMNVIQSQFCHATHAKMIPSITDTDLVDLAAAKSVVEQTPAL